MIYRNCTPATFITRLNRFEAEVAVDGRRETVHVKNTGRCRELLLPGCDVMLARADNPARKTRYDLISVNRQGAGWINIDSQAPNRVGAEFCWKSRDVHWSAADADIFPMHPQYAVPNIFWSLQVLPPAVTNAGSATSSRLMELNRFNLQQTSIRSLPKTTGRRFPAVLVRSAFTVR